MQELQLQHTRHFLQRKHEGVGQLGAPGEDGGLKRERERERERERHTERERERRERERERKRER